jgi:hypothetical protein
MRKAFLKNVPNQPSLICFRFIFETFYSLGPILKQLKKFGWRYQK